MPKGNKVADGAVQCDSDRDRALACSCTVTPGTDRDSDPFGLNLVWAGVVFCSCIQIWVGEASQTPGRVPWPSLAKRAWSSGSMAVAGGAGRAECEGRMCSPLHACSLMLQPLRHGVCCAGARDLAWAKGDT